MTIETKRQVRFGFSDLFGVRRANSQDHEGAVQDYIKTFGQAKQEIRVLSVHKVDNYFQDERVLQALMDASRRGVDVELITSQSLDEEMRSALKNSGVRVFVTENQKVVSQALIDRTDTAFKIQYGDNFIVKDHVRYPQYRNQYELIKAKATQI